MRRWLSIALCACCAGCYSPERDHVQDPYNTPLVHVLNAAYEPDRGSVLVRWEYLGYRPAGQFLVQRRLESGLQFQEIGRVKGEAPSAAGQAIASFRDTALVSGEATAYRVLAEEAEYTLAQSDPAEVRVPGVRMIGARGDPAGGFVQVLWDGTSAAGAAYEVIRRAGSGPEAAVWRTGDAGSTQFIDRAIRGNVAYTYLVRTQMPNGVRLESARATVRLYGLGGTFALSGPPPGSGGRMLVSAGPLQIDRSLYSLQVHPSGASLSQFRFYVGGGSPIVLAFDTAISLKVDALLPGSLSFAGPSVYQMVPSLPRVFGGGIDAAARQVVLAAYAPPQSAPALRQQGEWQAEAGDTRTAMSADPQGRLFVSAGRRLKAFDGDLREIGSVLLDAGEPGDLLAAQGAIWAAFPEAGRVLRGSVAFDGERLKSIVWQEVDLPSGAWPAALAGSASGLAFVLDAGNRRVLAFDREGRRLLDWDAPGTGLVEGDLTTDSSSSLVHVLDGTGRLYTFQP